jgi:hypothetical protein
MPEKNFPTCFDLNFDDEDVGAAAADATGGDAPPTVVSVELRKEKGSSPVAADAVFESPLRLLLIFVAVAVAVVFVPTVLLPTMACFCFNKASTPPIKQQFGFNLTNKCNRDPIGDAF